MSTNHFTGITELLESIGLFEGVSPKDLNILARRVNVFRYKAGQLIFGHGDTGSSMYIVVKGHVNIHLPGEASRPLSLKDVTRGEYFGELSLFDHEPRSASALAITDVELVELTRETLSHYIERRPYIAMVLLRTMSARLRETNRLLSQRVSKNVDAEFDKQLIWTDRLADKVAELNGSWIFIVILLGITSGWMFLNVNGVLNPPFDPYPYVFFNLLLAILVALQGPLIVMSQNRAALKDRTQARIDYDVNLKNEVNIEVLLRELREFHIEVNSRLQRLETQAETLPDQQNN